MVKDIKFVPSTPKTFQVAELKEQQIKKSPLSASARSKVINRSGSNYLSPWAETDIDEAIGFGPMARYCTDCKAEKQSRAEVGCKSSCGENCEWCCASCNKHTLIAGVMAVLEGKLKSPSIGLKNMVNDIRRGMNQVDKNEISEFSCTVEEGKLIQNNKTVDYTMMFKYSKGSSYTVYTSYRQQN